MASHKYYSERLGLNPNANGLPLLDICGLFLRIYELLRTDGYFDEALGSWCVDAGHISGYLGDVDLEILLAIRKKNLYPVEDRALSYSEDDLFDVIEFLYQHVSAPVEGTMHNYGGCGMHWETFNKQKGKILLREKVNGVLGHYVRRFELSANGEILSSPDIGFEMIFEADLPTKDKTVVDRTNAAVVRYRRHGSTADDRRQAVRDLVDVLEYLRPQLKLLLTKSDENDLFNIANNFGIRHLNDQQKTSYDAAIWHSWMFYFYLSTIHVVLRKIEVFNTK
ncbi:hypothetical protein HBH1_01167 [Herbaspirillum sp. BH-1]|uniref:Uncharacterized protein n=1 Tax=Herbaspirillum frisingense TaxID=92645 RepID=A0ABU1PAF3_9BURK|nr:MULTISPECIES: hypothetical protein [Herbaspirillum]MDR6582899.1 hypothetical protein [Herbaspirillum frisingense]PLY60521.1 hypothetical protein HBH1_01167 [Herbaspirillum sp. BH-1]